MRTTSKNYSGSWADLEDKDEEMLAKGKSKIPTIAELKEFAAKEGPQTL